MNEIVPADVVAAELARAYDVGELVSAELLRRGFNDTYAVELNGTKYAARVYLAGKYYLAGDDDIRYELDLLTYLANLDVGVSAPLPRRDGDRLGYITDAAGVRRPMALFTWAPGEPIAGNADPDVTREYGRTLGSIHTLAARFDSPHSRYTLDATYLVDQAERLLAERFEEAGDSRFDAYRPAFAEMRAFLAGQPRSRPAFGYVHGDPHGRNVHVDDAARVTFFDFDHGGFGWRAYDVVTALGSVPSENHRAFIEGYRSEHPLADEDESELEVWMQIRVVWDIGDMLAMAPVQNSDFNPSLDEVSAYLERVSAAWQAAST